MRLKRLITFSFLVVFLTGCASFPKTPETTSDFANRVQVSDSKFDSNIKFSGHTMSSDFLNGSVLCPYDWERYFLRGWKNKKNRNLTHQLYFSIDYYDGDWRHYNSASFDNGEQADITRIDQDVSCGSGGGICGCRYTEQVGLDLSDQFLKSKAKEGFTIRFNSKDSTNNFVNITPNYISGYLSVAK